MIIYPRLYLKYPFEITDVGGECVAIGVKEGAKAFHGVIKLDNDSALFMFKKLQEGITLPDLILACMKRYDDCPVEEAGPKVLAFLDTLKAENLIAVDTTQGVRDDRN